VFSKCLADNRNWPYYQANCCRLERSGRIVVKANLNSPQRQLIELRMEHADLDALIDRAGQTTPVDEISVRRLKKRRLVLRDHIEQLENMLEPKEPA
jgi:hypothetical protein